MHACMQVCVPLSGMVRQWVLEGELDGAAADEFFVVPAKPAAG